MAVKTTLRLPDRVARAVRERSEKEGRSFNETVVRALERGLETPDEGNAEWWKVFGDLVAVPPTRGSFDYEAMRRRYGEAGISFSREEARELMRLFDEDREDRV